MLTGKAPQQGFTYLWLLLAVAMGSAAATALGEMWQTQVQRSKEEETIFRGLQIAAALNSYAKVTPKGKPCAPLELDELLEDRRGLATQRHLRKRYEDPLTGRADWVIERDVAGGIMAVRSSASFKAIVTRKVGGEAGGGLQWEGERRFASTVQTVNPNCALNPMQPQYSDAMQSDYMAHRWAYF